MSAAADARRLMRHARAAAVATVAKGQEGWPFVSHVGVACAADATPVLLLSRLAQHTRNLEADPRACLLFVRANRRADPQTAARVSVRGRITKTTDADARHRFLAWQPAAGRYADFTDFAFHAMTVEDAHYVGGFGRIAQISGEHLLLSSSDKTMTIDERQEALAAINGSHPSLADRMAQAAGRRSQGWRVVAVDPEGCAITRRKHVVRIDFSRAAASLSDLFEIIGGATFSSASISP